jgi:hypothetical protein
VCNNVVQPGDQLCGAIAHKLFANVNNKGERSLNPNSQGWHFRYTTH